MAATSAFLGDGAGAARSHLFLGAVEVGEVDDRRVDDLLGPDPCVGAVPPHPGLVAECDVVDVQEDFLLALSVPYLVAGIARVVQNGADGSLGPGDALPVRIAPWVVGRRARDPVSGKPFGDGVEAAPVEIFPEDALDDRGGDEIHVKPVEPLAVGRFGRIGVRPGVRDSVAVGRSAAEEAAFELSLGRYGCPDADLDAIAFALAHAAEDGHHHVVSFTVGVDPPADLGNPQLDAVVHEEREGEAELVVVEDTLRLTDDDRIETAIRILQGREQLCGPRPSQPRQRPALPDIEVLGDDAAAGRFDERSGAGELPVPGSRRILQVFGGTPPGESEGRHLCPSSSSAPACTSQVVVGRGGRPVVQ
ncbi:MULTISPECIES: hypothetical protein [unclassified Streptomyces]|uniref:hypothetical protein n=1 Tax=Streptomyces sp. SID8354 TaxID=2690339 RepID=UPI001EF0A825|nr:MULTISPECIES: hypothetical protein [unclassified Streptomyces]